MEGKKQCVLDESKLCTDCGECDRCDLDHDKVCDSCMRCLGLSGGADYRAVSISGILLTEDGHDEA